MPKTSQVRLTKRVVDALPTDRELVLFDKELRGFGIRVKPGGLRTFLIQFRNKERRSRRVSLGQYGAMTVEQARAKAKVELGRVAAGEDVAIAREENRRAMSVAALGEAYFAAAQRGEVRGKRGLAKKASTLRVDMYRWNHHILPLLGARKARELSRRDITGLLIGANAKAGEEGYEGGGERRLKGMLGGVLGWAVDQGIIETNPCVGVKTRPDDKRRVALGEAGYKTLGRMLAAAEARGEPWQAIEATRVLALTGCRRGEITALRWSEVDLEGQALRLSDTKTGASVRPLGHAACEALRALRDRSTSEFVFPSTRKARTDHGAAAKERPFDGLPKAYGRICGWLRSALGEPVSPHGLRHAYASVAGEIYQIPTVAALIGHAAGSVTERYIHHVDAALIAAADATSGKISAWMAAGGNQALPVLAMAGLDPADSATVREVLDANPFTKGLPLIKREALAFEFARAVGFWRAGLSPLGVGKKRAAGAIDLLTSDCEAAFRACGVDTSVWSDDGGASPFLKFTRALAAAAGCKAIGASLKPNAIRGRRLKRAR